MTTLYLTRHGETIWNSEHRMQGWEDSPLSSLGIRQAEALRERLRDVKFDAVYASSTGRAVRTAEIARGPRPLPVQPLDDLREIGLGDWEGVRLEEAEAREPEAYRAFWETPHEYRPVGKGETVAHVQERVLRALETIVTEHPQGTVLVVTHTVALKALVAHLEGRSLARLWDPPYVKPTSLSIAEVTPKLARIHLHADASHLPER